MYRDDDLGEYEYDLYDICESYLLRNMTKLPLFGIDMKPVDKKFLGTLVKPINEPTSKFFGTSSMLRAL